MRSQARGPAVDDDATVPEATPRDPARADLTLVDLHGSLADPAMASMNFLNEIAGRFPDAVSFAAGRPFEGFFDVEDVSRYLARYCEHLRTERGFTEVQVRRTLLQYGRTKGIIHDLVARNLAVDEGITVDPEAIVVTAGCQEAMFLVLRALRATPEDVVLAVSPTYVGIAGAAALADMPVVSVRGGERGIDFDDLAAAVRRTRARGLRPRAVYVIPDFSNPAGVRLAPADRRRLLDLADEWDLLVLEDNPYGLFARDRLPTLKALDTRRRVVYLGSFAKTGLPGARVGYVVADQRVADTRGRIGPFADALSIVKSMLTVNTSPIAQAVIGGKLLACAFSLARANTRERAVYRANLDRMAAGLAQRFPSRSGGGPKVSWNAPEGGFFVSVTTPFVADDAMLERSAREFGLLWTPMHHFYAGSAGLPQLRLSISLSTPAEIDDGLDRLAALVASVSG